MPENCDSVQRECLREHCDEGNSVLATRLTSRASSRDQRCAKALLVLRRELCAFGGKVKHVDRHLAFGFDQRDLDIAVLACEIAS